MGSKVAHYAGLVVTENPVESHKRYLESLEEEAELLEAIRVDSEATVSPDDPNNDEFAAEAGRRREVRCRWHKAVEAITSSRRLIESAHILRDEYAGGAERFAAVVEVERMMHDNPHKKLLMHTLEQEGASRTDRLLDHIISELLLTGERIFDFFTPAEIGQHTVVFTHTMTFVCFIVFFYMIGAYPVFVAAMDPATAACAAAPTSPSGRRLFVDWMFPKGATWCYKGETWVMNAPYLQLWGARYGPLMKAQPSRWFTSWFIHHSFVHVTSNMALFVVVAHQIEEKYGCWRIALLYFISALGGSFFSATFESGCSTVQGASGGVFGMMGLFIADLVLNFETVKRPLLRGLLMVAFLIYFVASAATSTGSSSVWSHVGGFLCGLFPSFLFLPNLRSERWEQILPILGACVLLGVYVALPVIVYRDRLPRLHCSTA